MTKQLTLDLELDNSSLSLCSAKRTAVEKTGLHGWHPYYAGYSEAFVESAIRYLGCDRNWLLLDPWGGSGTTGIVAAKIGIPSICLDINPVMAIFAAAKSFQVLSQKQEIVDFLATIKDFIVPLSSFNNEEPLNQIFAPETARLIRSVVEVIPVNKSWKKLETINPIRAFYLSVIFVSLRKLSGLKPGSNPTWIAKNDNKVTLYPQQLFEEIRTNAVKMLRDIRDFYAVKNEIIPHFSLEGDARNMPLPRESVDAIIASPPYLTRIDYAISTMPEIYLLGGEDLLSRVRHQTMGAPVITKGEKYQKESWGPTCNFLLDSIKQHPTKAAKSYYWKNIVQYCMDLDKALAEIKRVLKPGGKGLIVVQNSYFKDLEIPLAKIYCEFAVGKGFAAEIVRTERVKNHLARVNSKSSYYKKEKVYYESVISIKNC
jgi:DNA modification methylase